MGLDMYLIENYEGPRNEGRDIGYWRKANAIHRWFVANVQEGVDDCGYYNVSLQQLELLRTTCKAVENSPSLSEELLPTTSGFLFGSTEYDAYYMEDIRRTIAIVEDAIELAKGGSRIDYHSSW